MAQPTITMRRGEELRIRQGHPWVFDNEITRVEGNPLPGGEVRVVDSGGNLLGYGFYNPISKIRARIFSKTASRADGHFFSERFREALEYRRRYFKGESESLRMVFGEADAVPGLIVDRFVDAEKGGSWLSVQFLSLGVDQRKSEIIASLSEVFQPEGIVERSDAPVRALEGLDPVSGIVAGSVPESIIIEENGAKYRVDLVGGQKTGWFLDQRANRAAVARYARGRSVLDVFCNQGGFGILCG
ncbi:MAG: hypothetical protein FD137_1885, partial [Spirochaetes bacterium]